MKYIQLTLILLTFFFTACKKEILPIENKSQASQSSCETCHYNFEMLKKVASPEEPPTGGGGCGGDAPYIEPWNRVYVNQVEYNNSTHAKLTCVWCHDGNDKTMDKNISHKNILKHPSENALLKCASCHTKETSNHLTSLHYGGFGQKHMVVSRYGANSFNELPELLKNGYKQNCATCHAGCGSCHLNRPVAGGGGLLNGHKFVKKPDMLNNCIACHKTRVGHAYLGEAPQSTPDVHLSKLGNGHCLNCHSGDEMHGDGELHTQRYQTKNKPTCEKCHSNMQNKNIYHSQHLNTFSCNTCHSQDYNNCGSCHIPTGGGHGGARIGPYVGFKIGMNPLKETKPYKFAVLRRALMAPDSWDLWGVPILQNFDSYPTFKYATPHNLAKWTTRTKVAVNKSCYDNCHIIKEGDSLRNKEIYLFKTDLQPWEINADKEIVVDGKLPSTWQIP